jgi:hypothetical protein
MDRWRPGRRGEADGPGPEARCDFLCRNVRTKRTKRTKDVVLSFRRGKSVRHKRPKRHKPPFEPAGDGTTCFLQPIHDGPHACRVDVRSCCDAWLSKSWSSQENALGAPLLCNHCSHCAPPVDEGTQTEERGKPISFLQRTAYDSQKSSSRERGKRF